MSTVLDDDFDVTNETIAVRLTHWDLMVLSAGSMPRLQALWAALLFVALGGFAALLAPGLLPGSMRAVLITLCACAVLAIAASMVGLMVAAFVVSTSPIHNPLLEERTYSLHPDGLRARTAERETLIEWPHVREVRRTHRFILIDVAPGLCHVLPRRCFASVERFRAFSSALQRLTRAPAARS